MAKRRLVASVLAAAVFLVLLAACSSPQQTTAPSSTTDSQPEASGSGQAESPAPSPGKYDDTVLKGTGEVVISTWGGKQTEAHTAAFFDPFLEVSGIKVVPATSPGYGEIKAMVESGNIQWDIVDLESFPYFAGVKEGWYEPIDYSLVDVSTMPQDWVQPYGVPTFVFGYIVGARAEAFPDGAPQTWAEFWDVERFPGPRSLQNYPVGNLEFALLADGVKPEDLYPLDVDRAFRKLDEIKPYVKVWWESFAQPAQLLADGEVDLATAYNGRLVDLIEKGLDIELVWTTGFKSWGYWSILKGAPNKENAMKFLAFAARPEQQAAEAMNIAYGPPSPEAFQYIPEERAKMLPTHPDHADKMFTLDERWWADHLDPILERWRDWLLK